MARATPIYIPTGELPPAAEPKPARRFDPWFDLDAAGVLANIGFVALGVIVWAAIIAAGLAVLIALGFLLHAGWDLYSHLTAATSAFIEYQ